MMRGLWFDAPSSRVGAMRYVPTVRPTPDLHKVTAMAGQSDNATDVHTMLAHRERQIAALRRVSEALLSQVTVDDLLRETLNVAVEVLAASAGSLQMHDTQDDALVFRCVTLPSDAHLLGLSVPTSRGISGQVFRSGTSNLTNEVVRVPSLILTLMRRAASEPILC
jgi:hypothetical protein